MKWWRPVVLDVGLFFLLVYAFVNDAAATLFFAIDRVEPNCWFARVSSDSILTTEIKSEP
jgi:hypothetical protein